MPQLTNVIHDLSVRRLAADTVTFSRRSSYNYRERKRGKPPLGPAELKRRIMSDRGNPPDGFPDGTPADPPGTGPDMPPADSIRERARGFELERMDHRSEDAVRALEARLREPARAYARWLVGANDAEDAVQAAFIKALDTFDPARGAPFPSFFMILLKRECIGILRKRKTLPRLTDLTTLADSVPGPRSGAEDPEAAAISRDIADQISAATQNLDLPTAYREALRQLIDDGGADRTAAGRKRTERTRGMLDEQAGLTAAEQGAARLLRQHRPIDEAAQGLLASARRKMFSLFGIQPEE